MEVSTGTVLKFTGWKRGNRIYLALLQDLDITPWLNSYSTNGKVQAGGFEGRNLRAGDVIGYKPHRQPDKLTKAKTVLMHWRTDDKHQPQRQLVQCIAGNEWHWLTEQSKELLVQMECTISRNADRMGYRLRSIPLQLNRVENLVSAAVGFGTIQLLPSGQLIVLMADHQTSGGYPRIAHFTSACLPALAQMRPNDTFMFSMTSLEEAETSFLRQQVYLQSVRSAAALHLENY